MGEKRFTKVEHIFEMNDEGVKDNNTKIDYYYALDMIDLLNELHEENEQLKYALNQRTEQCDKYYQENEQLKEFAQHNYSESKKIISHLQKENEQLKSEINMLKITIGRNEAYIKRITSNGKFSNTSMK